MYCTSVSERIIIHATVITHFLLYSAQYENSLYKHHICLSRHIMIGFCGFDKL